MKNFKFLGAIISNEGSKPEILSRIGQTTAVDSERSKKERKTEKKRWEDNIKEWTGMECGESLRAEGNGGKVLLQRHLWCPDDLRG